MTTSGFTSKVPIEQIIQDNFRYLLGRAKKRYPILMFTVAGNSSYRFNRKDFERWKLDLAIYLLEAGLATETT